MTRVKVYAYPSGEDVDEAPRIVGWFDPNVAIEYVEDRVGDANNTSVNHVAEFEHQSLFRTKGGRWVLLTWSQRQGVPPKHEFVDNDTAREWLLHNNEDDAAEKWFGELGDEVGPNLGGRPPMGSKVETRLSDEVLAAVDQEADVEGVTRAEMLRRLVMAGLASRRAPDLTEAEQLTRLGS